MSRRGGPAAGIVRPSAAESQASGADSSSMDGRGRAPRITGLRSLDRLISCFPRARPSWRPDFGPDRIAATPTRHCLVFLFARPPVSIAEAWDVAVTPQPLVPPSPPRASETMNVFGRMAAMRRSAIETWGQRAYEEDIVQGRFFGRSSFILNTPDAIRHVLVDNYENYTRTPAGIRVLRPMLGEGLLIAEGRAWKHQRRTLAPAFTPRAVTPLVPHMIAATDETIAKLQGSCGDAGRSARGDAADDARDRRAHHVLVRDGPPWRGVARLRDGIWRPAGAAAFSRSAAAAGVAEPAGFCPRALPQAMDAFRRPC